MPPRPRSSLARVLADLQTGLAAAGLEWYLFGARAAQLRGLRRATVDVDITVFAQSNDASVVVAALADSFSLRVPDLEAFVRTTRVLPLIHDRTSIPVDAVLGGPGLEPYFSRSRRVDRARRGARSHPDRRGSRRAEGARRA